MGTDLVVTAYRDTRAYRVDLGDGREFCFHRTIGGSYRPEFFGLPRGVGLTLPEMREFAAGLLSIIGDLASGDEHEVTPQRGTGDEEHLMDKLGQSEIEGRHPGMPTSDAIRDDYGAN